MPRPRVVLALSACLLLLASTLVALTAASSVPQTRAGDSSRSIGANDLKPSDCVSLNLTGLASGSGSVSGTDANDLVTGAAEADSLAGGAGDDCLLGGAGDDQVDGGPGSDVCLGGPGTDAFTSCETEIQ